MEFVRGSPFDGVPVAGGRSEPGVPDGGIGDTVGGQHIGGID